MTRILSFIAVLTASLFFASSASALVAPPVAANGNTVETYATGVAVPTQMTFGAGLTFVAGAVEGPAEGGIYVVRPGSDVAARIPGSPDNAFGVVWKRGTLYATQDTELVAYSKWNGKRFKKKKTLVRGPKTGFSGLAMGPNGRLYTGVQLKQAFDHKYNPMKYANTVISVKTSGKGFRVESKGLRQPWMMAFAKGEKSPIVSNLAQDLPEGTTAPDLLAKATPGSNFGFPKCNWAVKSACKKFTKPLLTIPKGGGGAASPMGIAADGRKLYVALFGGLGQGPGIATTNASGAPLKPFFFRMGPPVLSAALHNGYLYFGDLSATISRVKI